MSIVVLYESDEWSTYALRDYIAQSGIPLQLVNMEENINKDLFETCNLVVNRVFASSQFRNHQKSLAQTPELLSWLDEKKIPVVNASQAHSYEISKYLSTTTLAKYGISVPDVYGVVRKGKDNSFEMQYPCIMKPNCGGRTNYTFILHNEQEFQNALQQIPDIEMIVEQYIEPVKGFLTRIEVIGGECRLIVKRSVTENGLSAYHLGSKYEIYADCREEIRDTAVKAMELLNIEFGSMDIIENEDGFYIIDINAVSNASEDNTEMFHFDLMLETAKYSVEKYKVLQ